MYHNDPIYFGDLFCRKFGHNNNDSIYLDELFLTIYHIKHSCGTMKTCLPVIIIMVLMCPCGKAGMGLGFRV